ncbi:MAG: hypothetical protein JNN08_16970, partial [Bryobacterales bacterium]|nr:hypothetical protein [Bryobacterales bacterium]
SSTVLEGGSELNVVAALLKTWGVPFEILRLDQQRLDRYHLLERDGAPRYGTVLWAAGARGDAAVIGELVRESALNLIVFSDGIRHPEMARLTGLTYVSEYRRAEPLAGPSPHFVTRGVELPGEGIAPGYKVDVDGAEIVLRRGSLPFLAVREYPSGGRVVWLGAHRQTVELAKQFARNLLKRSLVWTQRSLLYANYDHSVLIEMHDSGNSEKTISPTWHLRTLSEEQFRTSVIEPLKRRKAVLTQVVNTGFVDRATRRVLNPWVLNATPDQLDPSVKHDYTSTKRGLDLGVREGVFEINSHGWTHVLPDLDSPPGPFWDAPLDGAGSLAWFNEFADRLRQQDIPAATQRHHMQRSIDYLAADFRVRPLFLRPPGGAGSLSPAAHTPRIAAGMGFGLTRISSPYFLSPALVLQLGPAVQGTTWAFNREYRASDVPWTPDGPFFLAFHDRDVDKDPQWFARVLNVLPAGTRFLTANEYTGYLHAEVTGDAGGFIVRYDPHYGQYFANRESSWVLHDEREARPARLPPGLGPHRVAVTR